MSRHRLFFAFSESNLSGIPLCRVLFQLLRAKDEFTEIRLLHAPAKIELCRFDDLQICERKLLHPSVSSPSRLQKALKWWRLSTHLAWAAAFWRNSTWYTDSIRAVALAILIHRIFFSRSPIIYHQFEAIDWDDCGKVNSICRRIVRRFAHRLDLVVVPEKNRGTYLQQYFPELNGRLKIYPNTCLSHPRIAPGLGEPLTITHVGSLGPDTYWRELLSLAKNHAEITFKVVGRVNPQFQTAAKTIPNLELCPTIPHDQLPDVYLQSDVGLVLYKPIDVNTRFAAPNKLYEFWSYGIPVIAPPLPGVRSQIHDPCLGELVDFESPDYETRFSSAVAELTRCPKDKIKSLFDTNLSAKSATVPLIDEISVL